LRFQGRHVGVEVRGVDQLRPGVPLARLVGCKQDVGPDAVLGQEPAKGFLVYGSDLFADGKGLGHDAPDGAVLVCVDEQREPVKVGLAV
jgi:hypothetical protein